MRGLGAWLLSLPLTGGGLFLAHELSYRAAAPHPHEREALLEHTGHGYFEHTPVAAALAVALLIAGVGVVGAGAFRGRMVSRVSLWPFAVLPGIAFAVQEHVERLVHGGDVAAATALEPTFALGLVLQLPFGLAAFLLARALLAAAERIGAALLSAPRLVPFQLSAQVLSPWADSPRWPVLARGYAGRAPPVFLAT